MSGQRAEDVDEKVNTLWKRTLYNEIEKDISVVPTDVIFNYIILIFVLNNLFSYICPFPQHVDP